jgi:GNAT superfamily N-acetyltransferase
VSAADPTGGPAPALAFRPAHVDSGPGAVLVQAMRDEMAVIYDGLDLDAADMPRAGAAELGPPGGAFRVGWHGEVPVCCGGIKRLDEEACEIKRMYVAPQARGQGVARALLGALEQVARDLGYAVARLDTGPRQAHALALYRSSGYVEIPNFNGNPAALYFAEKPLR